MAARRSAKQPPPGEWQYTTGEIPVQLTAYERKDKGNRIYTRVWNGRKIGEKKALCGAIRDARGRVDSKLELEAQRLAIKRQEALAAGLKDEDVLKGPLTLARGFRQLLHPKEGKYVGRSEHAAEVKRHTKRIMKVLGAELLWEHVRHRHYRKLWRDLAHEYAKTDTYGLRQSEVIVGVLQSAARWLQGEGLLEPGLALPAPNWKQVMAQEWVEISGAPVPEVSAPRYTEAESVKLWAAIADQRVDPRLGLAFDIGAELRLGQVPRSRRSDVETDESGFPISVRVHGSGKKLGELVVLTPEQAATLHYQLHAGYLREFEAEHQGGRLADYYLIPGGHLRYWRSSRKLDYPVAQLKNAHTPATESALGDWWRKLEQVAGVPHVEGRRWYGMRRLQSDLAEDVEVDARVLNRLGAWKHTSTRERYQERRRTKIQQQAADVRRKIRPRKDLPPTKEGEE
jgi:hypothetical protein